MKSKNEFVEHLLDLLKSIGDVRARAMFGGFGIYRGDLMFGLVADDVFYLKTDDENRPDFDALDLPPFIYVTKDGKEMVMPYYRPPDSALDDPEEMAEWARKAYDAALRSGGAKKKGLAGKGKSAKKTPRERKRR